MTGVEALAPTCVAVFVDESGDFDHARRAAVGLAAKHGARLILYDSTTASAFTEPVRSTFSAEGAGQQYGPLLSDVDLERLGRSGLARQVREARDERVDAWAHLASEHGAEPFVQLAREQGADLLVLPEELGEPGVVDRLRGETLEEAEETTRIPIVVVDRAGNLT
jgi:nucleotide-binding universal stress UspA family protein